MADLDSPIDRLLKQIQAVQGIKGIFEPTAYQQSQQNIKLNRHTKILNTYLDKIDVTHSNNLLEADYQNFRQYYTTNVDGMDVNIQELFQEGEKNYQRQFSENTDFKIQYDRFYNPQKYGDETVPSLMGKIMENIDGIILGQSPPVPGIDEVPDWEKFNDDIDLTKFSDESIKGKYYVPGLKTIMDENGVYGLTTFKDLHDYVTNLTPSQKSKGSEDYEKNTFAVSTYDRLLRNYKNDYLETSRNDLKGEGGAWGDFLDNTQDYVDFLNNISERHGARLDKNSAFKQQLGDIASVITNTKQFLYDDNIIDEQEHKVIDEALLTMNTQPIEDFKLLKRDVKTQVVAKVVSDLDRQMDHMNLLTTVDGIGFYDKLEKAMNMPIGSSERNNFFATWEGKPLEGIFASYGIDYIAGLTGQEIWSSTDTELDPAGKKPNSEFIYNKINEDYIDTFRSITNNNNIYRRHMGTSYVQP